MANTEYSCWFYLKVRRKDGEQEFSRHVFLPFVPTTELRFVFDDERLSFADPQRVEYRVEDGGFHCYADDDTDDCPCKPEDECCVFGKDGGSELTGEYLQDGWDAVGPVEWLRDHIWRRLGWQFTAEQLGVSADDTPAIVKDANA